MFENATNGTTGMLGLIARATHVKTDELSRHYFHFIPHYCDTAEGRERAPQGSPYKTYGVFDKNNLSPVWDVALRTGIITILAMIHKTLMDARRDGQEGCILVKQIYRDHEVGHTSLFAINGTDLVLFDIQQRRVYDICKMVEFMTKHIRGISLIGFTQTPPVRSSPPAPQSRSAFAFASRFNAGQGGGTTSALPRAGGSNKKTKKKPSKRSNRKHISRKHISRIDEMSRDVPEVQHLHQIKDIGEYTKEEVKRNIDAINKASKHFIKGFNKNV